jgi:hypothetical protein
MLHRVVMPFPCSWDGITLVDLAIGDERDFGTMADGLIGMGWIEPIEVKLVVAVKTVAEREVAVDLLPVETAEESAGEDTAVEPTPALRRGRKRS